MGNQTSTDTKGDVDSAENSNLDVPKKKIPLKKLSESVLLDFPNSDDESDSDEYDSDEGQSCVTHSSLFSGASLYSNASFTVASTDSALNSCLSADSDTRRRRRSRRSKESVRLAVLKVNRRLLNLLNQDNPVDPESKELDSEQKELSVTEFTEQIMKEGSNRSVSEGAVAGNAPRGLPGFLRRSLRGVYDEEQSVSPGGNNDNYSPSTGAFAAGSFEAPTSIDSSNIDSSKDTNYAGIAEQSASSQSRPNESSISSDTNGAADSATSISDSNESKEPSRTKTYRETTFENCIKSPIVDLRDLRRLGWNGIPVSLSTYTFHALNVS